MAGIPEQEQEPESEQNRSWNLTKDMFFPSFYLVGDISLFFWVLLPLISLPPPLFNIMFQKSQLAYI